MNQTTRKEEFTRKEAVLHLSFDLGWKEWKLAFGTSLGEKARLRTLPARDLEGLLKEIERAKERFGLPCTARVVSEARSLPEPGSGSATGLRTWWWTPRASRSTDGRGERRQTV